MNRVRQRLVARLRTSSLARDASHLSFGHTVRLVIQAAFYVVLARVLGPTDYGAFAAAAASAAVIGPFAGIGSSNLFIKNVKAGSQEPAVSWGNGLLITAISGSLLSLGVAFFSIYVLRQRPAVIFMICAADLVMGRVIELAACGFLACGRAKQTSVQNVLLSLLRLASLVTLALVRHRVTLESWTLTYLITSVVAGIYCFYKGTQSWGAPRFALGQMRADLRDGFFFSVSSSATTIYNDIDKIMLGRLADFTATGIYAAAYRIIDVATQPIRSIATAAYPRFFEKGVRGIQEPYSFARTIISITAKYGILVLFALLGFAPIVPHILGPRYAAVVPALRLLAALPLIRAIHVSLGDALAGAGFVRLRTVIQVAVAALNVVLNLLILPRYSWRGAAWTSIASDGMLALLCWLAVVWHARRQCANAPLTVEVAGNG
jgi:O-antigen/teichoic acid export membrane protein